MDESTCTKEKFCKLLLDKYKQGKVSPEILSEYIKQHCLNYKDCKAECPVRIEFNNLELSNGKKSS